MAPPSETNNHDGEPVVVAVRQVLPRRNCDYGTREYWHDRFLRETEYGWLLSFADLAPYLQPYLQPSSRILIVGCGNSPFSADLYNAGYTSVTNVDYAASVINVMRARHAERSMTWHCVDVTKADEMAVFDSFDVVIDKATTDAICASEGDVWHPRADVVAAVYGMNREISRLLRPGGVYLQISLVQPHFRRPYLLGWHANDEQDNHESWSARFRWTVESSPILLDGLRAGGAFGYFLYTATKDQ
jgi:EEF1A lysine methyltransferase 4